MVDVGVRDDDLLHLQIMLADDGGNVFNVVAGIDDHRFARGLVPNDGAIALQRAHWQNFVNHAVQFSVPSSRFSVRISNSALRTENWEPRTGFKTRLRRS